MREQKKYYYQADLEVVLKGKDFIFGYINISHIPYAKLEELFREQVQHERFLFDDAMSYVIDKELYTKHQAFLEDQIPFTFDFDLFDYTVGYTSIEADKYVKNYYEELPPAFS
ncbi:hypothetical protein [Chitinophaga solisilvae]|uniref:Uncharacterized protein n=1 Tax=Chitinophaga solisilvae TaxID=1233460 RepID=A0A3S1B2D2_9BACT|nr:hypothetical protein [Chitinophaga solisilvae]NSL85319.1 hypothetical protein [Chitinophaga solisilvae]